MKALKGNVIIKINTKQKWKYALTEDIELYIEKGFDFNKRQDMPSRAEVIDGEGLPAGAEILIHHNATGDSYEVPYIHEFLTEEEIEEDYKIYSIPMDMCFAYFHGQFHLLVN